MKKVILALAVASVFVACDSKKKEETPAPTTNTTPADSPAKPVDSPVKPVDTPATGAAGKVEALKDAANKGGEAVNAAKEGDMNKAGEKGKEAVDAAKKVAQ
jgi:hypothetical protein